MSTSGLLHAGNSPAAITAVLGKRSKRHVTENLINEPIGLQQLAQIGLSKTKSRTAKTQ